MKLKQLILFLGAVETIILIGHLTVFFVLISLFPTIPKLYLGLTLLILGVTFLAASLISARFNNPFSRTFYMLSAIWLGTLLYLFMASLLYTFAAILLSGSSAIYVGRVGVSLLILAITISIYGIINSYAIRVTQAVISASNIDGDWSDKKIAFISDTHFGQIRGIGFAKKISNLLKRISPDIIIIGGDFFDGGKIDAPSILNAFSFRAPLGNYYITGNHEEYGDAKFFKNIIQNNGIEVLEEKFAELQGVKIIGLGNGFSRDRESTETFLKNLGLTRKTFNILVQHIPDDLELAARNNISLQLSGHTHRGQIFPGRLFTKRIFKGFDYGLKEHQSGLKVYTSSGAGTWGPPMRIGTNPEIAVIKFSKMV